MKKKMTFFVRLLCLFCLSDCMRASEGLFTGLYSMQINYRSLLANHLDCQEDMASLLAACRNVLYGPEDATLQELAQMTSVYQNLYWNTNQHEFQNDENRLFCWLYHEIKNGY